LAVQASQHSPARQNWPQPEFCGRACLTGPRGPPPDHRQLLLQACPRPADHKAVAMGRTPARSQRPARPPVGL